MTWDATMLRAFMECPQKFKLAHVDHYRLPDAPVDLDFGSWVHLGIETFYRGIVTEGLPHDEALMSACLAVLDASWRVEFDPADPSCPPQQGPMHGQYAPAWHCLGQVKYKNEKGNPAKCPYSHKGKLFPAPVPQSCSCGSAVESLKVWVPTSKVKDRYNAVRAVVWYADEMRDSHFNIVSFGRDPLVEVQGRMWSEGANAEFVANFDAVKAFGDEIFVVDFKTTGMSLGRMYFDSFQPGIQFDFYNTLGPLMQIEDYGTLPVSGVIIEAFQFLQSGVRIGMRVYRLTDEQRQEVISDIGDALVYHEQCKTADRWPRNRASCMRCQFKPVCSAPPDKREAILAEHYIRAKWNPDTRRAEPVI